MLLKGPCFPAKFGGGNKFGKGSDPKAPIPVLGTGLGCIWFGILKPPGGFCKSERSRLGFVSFCRVLSGFEVDPPCGFGSNKLLIMKLFNRFLSPPGPIDVVEPVGPNEVDGCVN